MKYCDPGAATVFGLNLEIWGERGCGKVAVRARGSQYFVDLPYPWRGSRDALKDHEWEVPRTHTLTHTHAQRHTYIQAPTHKNTGAYAQRHGLAMQAYTHTHMRTRACFPTDPDVRPHAHHACRLDAPRSEGGSRRTLGTAVTVVIDHWQNWEGLPSKAPRLSCKRTRSERRSFDYQPAAKGLLALGHGG